MSAELHSPLGDVGRLRTTRWSAVLLSAADRPQGLGFEPVYAAVLDEIARSSRLQTIGIAKGLQMEIFAITAQRRLQHPGVVALKAESG